MRPQARERPAAKPTPHAALQAQTGRRRAARYRPRPCRRRRRSRPPGAAARPTASEGSRTDCRTPPRTAWGRLRGRAERPCRQSQSTTPRCRGFAMRRHAAGLKPDRRRDVDAVAACRAGSTAIGSTLIASPAASSKPRWRCGLACRAASNSAEGSAAPQASSCVASNSSVRRAAPRPAHSPVRTTAIQKRIAPGSRSVAGTFAPAGGSAARADSDPCPIRASA